MREPKTKILAVAAHPDDEILFLWPLLQDDKYDRHLVVISDNRQRYADNAVNALERFCGMAGIHFYACVGLDAEFYRLPTRYEDALLIPSCEMIKAVIGYAVDHIKPDYLFTHNPVGEYGHGDHKLAFELVNSLDLPTLYTDIVFANKTHLSYETMPEFIKQAYYHSTILFEYDPIQSPIIRDEEFFQTGKEIYQQHKAWSFTDDKSVPKKASVYGPLLQVT